MCHTNLNCHNLLSCITSVGSPVTLITVRFYSENLRQSTRDNKVQAGPQSRSLGPGEGRMTPGMPRRSGDHGQIPEPHSLLHGRKAARARQGSAQVHSPRTHLSRRKAVTPKLSKPVSSSPFCLWCLPPRVNVRIKENTGRKAADSDSWHEKRLHPCDLL